MKARTADTEERRGLEWIGIGVFFLTMILGVWWLAAATNAEVHHDARWIPVVAVIPLVIGAYHLLFARHLHRH
jgi:hypothetical protein